MKKEMVGKKSDPSKKIRHLCFEVLIVLFGGLNFFFRSFFFKFSDIKLDLDLAK